MDGMNIGLNRNPAPCKGCVRTHKRIGCHADCHDYLEWKAEGDAAMQRKIAYLNKPFSPIK